MFHPSQSFFYLKYLFVYFIFPVNVSNKNQMIIIVLIITIKTIEIQNIIKLGFLRGKFFRKNFVGD